MIKWLFMVVLVVVVGCSPLNSVQEVKEAAGERIIEIEQDQCSLCSDPANCCPFYWIELFAKWRSDPAGPYSYEGWKAITLFIDEGWLREQSKLWREVAGNEEVITGVARSLLFIREVPREINGGDHALPEYYTPADINSHPEVNEELYNISVNGVETTIHYVGINQLRPTPDITLDQTPEARLMFKYGMDMKEEITVWLGGSTQLLPVEIHEIFGVRIPEEFVGVSFYSGSVEGANPIDSTMILADVLRQLELYREIEPGRDTIVFFHGGMAGSSYGNTHILVFEAISRVSTNALVYDSRQDPDYTGDPIMAIYYHTSKVEN